MTVIDEAITEAFGERCPEYAEGCPCCDAWAELDALRREIAELKERLEVCQ